MEEKKMTVDTSLPHAILDGVPVLDLHDVIVQEVLDMDFAVSEAHINMFVNVYRTVGKHPAFKLGEQAFLSVEEAFASAYRPEWFLIYEGVLPLTVRQAKQKGLVWGQNPALVRKIKEEWDSIPLSQDEDDLDD